MNLLVASNKSEEVYALDFVNLLLSVNAADFVNVTLDVNVFEAVK